MEGGQKGRETPEEEEGYESDSSDQTGSSFGSLLARVDLEYAKQRSKGKEREAEEMGVLSGEEEEEDGEEVGREEGARNPRDMLREQLKRSESRGRVRGEYQMQGVGGEVLMDPWCSSRGIRGLA